MIDKIIFKGYKSFKNLNELDIKPITVVFGKNSAGKSALVKLPIMIAESLKGNFNEPFRYINNGIQLGGEYRDLFYNRIALAEMSFEIFSTNNKLKVEITNSHPKPIITSWNWMRNDRQKVKISSEEIKKEGGNIFSGFRYKLQSTELDGIFDFETDYIGPFRVTPSRINHKQANLDLNSMGNYGENAYEALVEDKDLLEKVSKWYENNFDGWGIHIKEISNPYYEIRVRQKGSTDDGVNIVDVGQGISQALPIIVKTQLRNCNPQIVVLEQPELHLHPAAHGNLAELIFQSTERTDHSYLIETHSKNFILRLRRLIAEGVMPKEALNLYWVDYDSTEECSFLKEIKINDLGEVDFWPEGIFNESFEETLALRKAQKDRTEKEK